MQQPEEATPEAEPERHRRLRLPDQRRVVELQPVERIAQIRIVRPVNGIEARVHHRLGFAVAGERVGGAVARGCHGVADLRLPDILHTGDEVPDLADAQPCGRLGFGRHDADFQQFVGGPGGHHLDPFARQDLAVDNADVRHHAAVDVVDGVEDHRACRRVGIALRGRHLTHHMVEQVGDAVAGLAGHPQHVGRLAPDDVGDLGGVAIRVGGGQVDLVQHRDDVQVAVQRQVQIRQRLRLDALGGVDQQHRALARLQRPRHLVGEVDVTRCVDQMKDVIRAVEVPGQPDVLRLDRDAAFAFDVHPVQVLRAHIAVGDHAGELQHPVGQRGLAVVDVGDDAEVPNLRRRGEGLVGETAYGNLLVRRPIAGVLSAVKGI